MRGEGGGGSHSMDHLSLSLSFALSLSLSLSLSHILSSLSSLSLSFVIFLNISLFCVHLSVLMSVSRYISLSQSSIFSSPFATLHICLWRGKKGLPINNQLQFLLPSLSFVKPKNKKNFLKIPFRLMRISCCFLLLWIV